jgi:hypothetical protein
LTRAEYDRSHTTIHNAWATYRHNLHRWDIQQQEEKLPRRSPKYLAAIRAQKHQQPREEQLLREAQRLKREERVRKEQRLRANREAEAQRKIVEEQQRKLRETMQRKVEEEQRQREEHELKVRQQMEEVERRRAAETERREKEREELEVKKQAKCFQTDQTADSANNGLGVSATDESESSMRDRRQVSHDDNEGQQRAMDNEHAISTPVTQRPPESIRNETVQEPRVRRSKRSTSASRRRLRFHVACQHAQRRYCKVLQTLGGLGHEDELKGMSIDLGWQDEEADGECDDCGDFIDSEMWVCPEGGARMCEECYMKLSWYDGSRLVYVLVQRAQEA